MRDDGGSGEQLFSSAIKVGGQLQSVVGALYDCIIVPAETEAERALHS